MIALTLTFGAIWIPILITIGLFFWGIRSVPGDMYGLGGLINMGGALILALITWVIYLAIT